MDNKGMEGKTSAKSILKHTVGDGVSKLTFSMNGDQCPLSDLD